MNRLGVVGGLGPMATVCFIKRIIEMTDAVIDQEHINMVIEHCPSIPDRTAYILDNKKEDPASLIIQACEVLERADVTEIAIPCVTAHYFRNSISRSISVPVMDGVLLCAEYIAKSNIKKVGIMATDGTVKADLFGHALTDHNIEYAYPDNEHQKYVMEIIYEGVKQGKRIDKEKFYRVSQNLREKGAELIILGCTELSVVAEEWLPEGRYLDVLSVLARACVKDFGKLKEKYRELI